MHKFIEQTSSYQIPIGPKAEQKMDEMISRKITEWEEHNPKDDLTDVEKWFEEKKSLETKWKGKLKEQYRTLREESEVKKVMKRLTKKVEEDTRYEEAMKRYKEDIEEYKKNSPAELKEFLAKGGVDMDDPEEVKSETRFFEGLRKPHKPTRAWIKDLMKRDEEEEEEARQRGILRAFIRKHPELDRGALYGY